VPPQYYEAAKLEGCNKVAAILPHHPAPD
jgi:hypothetical protein